MAELLKAFSQNDFKRCFEAWKACTKQCVASHRNCSEGDSMDTIILSIKYIFNQSCYLIVTPCMRPTFFTATIHYQRCTKIIHKFLGHLTEEEIATAWWQGSMVKLSLLCGNHLILKVWEPLMHNRSFFLEASQTLTTPTIHILWMKRKHFAIHLQYSTHNAGGSAFHHAVIHICIFKMEVVYFNTFCTTQ